MRMDQSKFRNMDAKASCVGRKNNLIANNANLWGIPGMPSGHFHEGS